MLPGRFTGEYLVGAVIIGNPGIYVVSIALRLVKYDLFISSGYALSRKECRMLRVFPLQPVLDRKLQVILPDNDAAKKSLAFVMIIIPGRAKISVLKDVPDGYSRRVRIVLPYIPGTGISYFIPVLGIRIYLPVM